MPTVLLDLRMVRGRLHGIARYALELAARLPALARDLTFEALVAPEGLPAGLGPLTPKLTLHRSNIGFLSPLEQPVFAAQLARLGPELFHATSFSLPLLWPGRLVATLHDATHLVHSSQYGAAQAVYYRAVVGPRARRARALITVSEHSRRELSRELGLDEQRLQVIRSGVDARFHPASPSQRAELLRDLDLPPRFLLAVGNAKEHKNLGMLADLAPELSVPIVLLAGENAVFEIGFPEGTRALADVPEDTLPVLYSAASALLLPSRHEGFGLPALEAMACGTPVIAANAGALPEVTGSAAVLLSPDDSRAWHDAIERLLRDPAQATALSEAGLTRAAHFTWESCAEQTLAVYRRALEARASDR